MSLSPLQMTHKQLAEEWDVTLNKNVTPSDVNAEAHKRIWWKCEFGHKVFEPVRERVRNNGCSKCLTIKRREVRFEQMVNREFFSFVESPISNTFQDWINYSNTKIKLFFYVEEDYTEFP